MSDAFRGALPARRLRLHLVRNLDLYGAGAVASLFVLHLFTSPYYFFGSGTDLPRMEYPWHVFATQWMSRGILPLWNPFVLAYRPRRLRAKPQSSMRLRLKGSFS